MKKYDRFYITWIENGENNEIMDICKIDSITNYLNLMHSGRDISSLSIYGMKFKDFIREEITGSVNRFLAY